MPVRKWKLVNIINGELDEASVIDDAEYYLSRFWIQLRAECS